MAIVDKIIVTCFDRFNEISTTKVAFDQDLVGRCHALRVDDTGVCISTRTDRKFDINGITATCTAPVREIKFLYNGEVIYTLPKATGFRKAVFGQFLHALEKMTITAATFRNLMKLMAGIINDVIDEAYAGKLLFASVAALLESIEVLQEKNSYRAARLNETAKRCADAAKFASEH